MMSKIPVVVRKAIVAAIVVAFYLIILGIFGMIEYAIWTSNDSDILAKALYVALMSPLCQMLPLCLLVDRLVRVFKSKDLAS